MIQKRNRFSTNSQKSKKIALDFQPLANPKIENMKRRSIFAKRRFVRIARRFIFAKMRFIFAKQDCQPPKMRKQCINRGYI